jgi:hypothetical protein
MDNLVSVKEEDFLEQDPPLRNQNYVCLSFVSPEEILKKKECFIFEEYIKHFSKEMNDFFNSLGEKYPDDKDGLNSIKERYSSVFDTKTIQEEYNFFSENNSEALNKTFYEENNFQTSIRGIKIRGVFDTLKEANIRAEVLKRKDDRFHIYVGEVGCWLPWCPNPNDIQEQEFSEDSLNTLMKKYKENQEKKDEFFEKRKRDLISKQNT